MSFKEERKTPSNGLKKFSQWEGDWNDYLGYLEQNNALSPNFICEGGDYRLRDGYYPEPYSVKGK